MSLKVVIDTNVLVAGLIDGKGPNREVLRYCFEGILQPCVGNALYAEYQDLLSRDNIQALCNQTSVTLTEFLNDFASVCKPADVWFLWQPNLKDEADNHIVELAVAANARYINIELDTFTKPQLIQLTHIGSPNRRVIIRVTSCSCN